MINCALAIQLPATQNLTFAKLKHVQLHTKNLGWHIALNIVRQPQCLPHNPCLPFPPLNFLQFGFASVKFSVYPFLKMQVLFSVSFFLLFYFFKTVITVDFQSCISLLGKRRCIHCSWLEPNGSLHSISLHKGTGVIILTSSSAYLITQSKWRLLCRVAALFLPTIEVIVLSS